MIFPWQNNQWQQLLRVQRDNRLPHALLFAGMAGIGKTHFAECFIRMLMCEQIDNFPQDKLICDTCHACRLVMAKVHPDILWVNPDQVDSVITIDQIRELSHFIHQSSSQGRHKIVVACFAERMNTYAANALLKTLEEPSPGSLILLISDQRERLPATILSRCQCLTFPRPQQEQALLWLQSQLKNSDINPLWLLNIANGAPLAALQFIADGMLLLRQRVFEAFCLSDDPLQAAAGMLDDHSLQIVDFSLSWISDLLRLQLDANTDKIVNQDYVRQLNGFIATNVDKNIKFMNYLLDLRKQICQGINLNKQLMIESILIRWKAA
ncbi:MAG TPA: DNA polymerase III subunit delta' [Gammaproteobacteria bacterium]|nr:DNA polymerase III subunit delta' [Gammaproteobacteria bacterium]